MYFYESYCYVKVSERKLSEEELWDSSGEYKNEFLGGADTRRDARELLRKHHFTKEHITEVLNEAFGKSDFKLINENLIYEIYKEDGWYYAYAKNPTEYSASDNALLCLSENFNDIKVACEIYEENCRKFSDIVTSNLMSAINKITRDSTDESIYLSMGQIEHDIFEKLHEIEGDLKERIDNEQEQDILY